MNVTPSPSTAIPIVTPHAGQIGGRSSVSDSVFTRIDSRGRRLRPAFVCQTRGVASQTWNSPVSAPSPPPWVVAKAPPSWFTERVEQEGADDAVATWREALLELGVVEVRLTADVRGVTIDFDGAAPQAVNDNDAKPLSSAIGRGIDRLRTKRKSEESDRARRSARQDEPE